MRDLTSLAINSGLRLKDFALWSCSWITSSSARRLSTTVNRENTLWDSQITCKLAHCSKLSDLTGVSLVLRHCPPSSSPFPLPCPGSVLKYSDGKQIFKQKFNNKAEPFSKNKWTTIGIGQKGCEIAGRGVKGRWVRGIYRHRVVIRTLFFTSCVQAGSALNN